MLRKMKHGAAAVASAQTLRKSMRMLRWVNSPLTKTAIEIIVAARQAAGLTQRELADRMEMPRSMIAKIEMGDRRLDLLEFIAMSRAIGVDEQELFRQVIAGLK